MESLAKPKLRMRPCAVCSKRTHLSWNCPITRATSSWSTDPLGLRYSDDNQESQELTGTPGEGDKLLVSSVGDVNNCSKATLGAGTEETQPNKRKRKSGLSKKRFLDTYQGHLTLASQSGASKDLSPSNKIHDVPEVHSVLVAWEDQTLEEQMAEAATWKHEGINITAGTSALAWSPPSHLKQEKSNTKKTTTDAASVSPPVDLIRSSLREEKEGLCVLLAQIWRAMKERFVVSEELRFTPSEGEVIMRSNYRRNMENFRKRYHKWLKAQPPGGDTEL